MVNFGPLTAEIGWRALEHPRKFQQVSCLGFVTAPTSLNGGQPNLARWLAVFWLLRYIYCPFLELLPHNVILPGAKFLLRPSLAFSCIGSVTARHSSSRRQPYLRRGTRNGITELSLLIMFNRGRRLYSDGGHHVGHRPTF